MFKKYWFIFLALAFTITAIITGCETLQTTGTSGGREYFPNTDGYSWTFRVSSPSTSETATMKFTANGTGSVGSVTAQKVKIEMSAATSVSTSEYLVGVTDSGVTIYGPVGHATTEGSQMIAFPLSVGSHWYVYQTQEASVVAQEDVAVPARTYSSCFKARMATAYSWGTATIDYWLAKNVGVVKVLMTQVLGTTETNSVIELTAKSF